MKYKILFDIDTFGKRGLVKRKSGEIEVTTDATLQDLTNNEELKLLIATDIQPKVKGTIFNVEINEILPI